METIDPLPPTRAGRNTLNPSTTSPSPSPSPSPSRLWRPAAQRNVRNQWSKLAAGKDRWLSAAAAGRSHATALVNAYLSRKYMPSMDLGVLKDMLDIRQKACEKLLRKQETYHSKLVSSYKEMVLALLQLVNAASSMRCYSKGSDNGPLIQFSEKPVDENDSGDGRGIPVFSLLSIPQLEKLAQEIVDMFRLELAIKRFLVIEFLSIGIEEDDQQKNKLKWSDELYLGEFDDLRASNLFSEDSFEPLPPRIMDQPPGKPMTKQSSSLNAEVFQVYLTTWLVDLNVDINSVNDILSHVEGEIRGQR